MRISLPVPARLAPAIARASVALARALSLPRRAGNVDYLDGWRGLCILLVMLGHFIDGLAPLARAGVELFFVLSGRLMAEILVLKREPVARFIARRASRVLPATAAFIAITAIPLNAVRWMSSEPTNWVSPAAAILFVHNYIPADSTLPAFQHLWSLAVEEHSYLTLVAIVLASRRHPTTAMILALIVSVLAIANGAWLWAHPSPGEQNILRRSDFRVASVLLSFATCLLFHRWKGEVAKLSLLSPMALVLAVWIAATDQPPHPLQLALGTIAGAIAVNTLGISAGRFRAFLSHPFLVWAGTLSFSLYLWQQSFYAANQSGILPAIVGVPLAVACALWSFRKVEQPARDYLNARWNCTAGRDHRALAHNADAGTSRARISRAVPQSP